MLTDRIIGAITFKREVYAEVESDTSFTQTAWIIVVVVSALAQLGAAASPGRGIVGWILAAIIFTVFAVVGFAVGAFVINWVGKQLFQADVSFEELVRTLGLAYVWQAVGVLGILGFVPALGCLLVPIRVVAGLAGLVAWLFAAKEALDLEWGQTAVTVIIGWVVLFIITLIAGAVVALFGLGATAARGAFGQ